MPSRPAASLVVAVLILATAGLPATAYDLGRDKFRQLEEVLPTPNAYRTASGAPGHDYWQQRADYDIKVHLDDEQQRIEGSETITYTNVSPDQLRYLWLQLDANLFDPTGPGALTQTAPDFEKFPYRDLAQILALRKFQGGDRITSVAAEDGTPLAHTIVQTMMRVDLPKPLESGETMKFSVQWSYPINDAKVMGGRSGYEHFDADDNYIYEIAQFYPRMVAYMDATGWQHKQFLGRGEFTLDFGDYHVEITAPADHVVGATGVLQNPDAVLAPAWKDRLDQAETADKPVFIITPAEAKANESSRATGEKTWIFEAENVRDFAFASSRKFIWDAQRHDVEGNHVLAMSFYPNEAEPLWSRYSTAAIVHTLDVYSRYTFPYPYPVAISVNGPV
ncbi:MAG: aminopeptidase, partial [Acidobacteria bacterium]|nr:aminopeptidase [Acidobacteriota bacterium]